MTSFDSPPLEGGEQLTSSPSIVIAIVSCIDLTTLDNLSRTCRQVREALLEYRKVLLISSLRCCNDELPPGREETQRYRVRAGNWYYMEDTGRTCYYGKSGCCARDLVTECRRCGNVVCRVSTDLLFIHTSQKLVPLESPH